VYACGPLGMMQRAQQLSDLAGARCFVSLENNMACGFGICLGCVVKTAAGFRYVCTDGPVFDAATLGWGVRA
jgi:dihydroorotate dehydrogenase electron transfer subunit